MSDEQESPEAPPPRWWAVLDDDSVVVGFAREEIAGAPSFDHEPDVAPGKFLWSRDRARFEPIASQFFRAAKGPALDAKAMKALALLIVETAERGEPVSDALMGYARDWSMSFDAQGGGGADIRARIAKLGRLR
jgi:hypothetical protein